MQYSYLMTHPGGMFPLNHFMWQSHIDILVLYRCESWPTKLLRKVFWEVPMSIEGELSALLKVCVKSVLALNCAKIHLNSYTADLSCRKSFSSRGSSRHGPRLRLPPITHHTQPTQTLLQQMSSQEQSLTGGSVKHWQYCRSFRDRLRCSTTTGLHIKRRQMRWFVDTQAGVSGMSNWWRRPRTCCRDYRSWYGYGNNLE